MALDRMVTDGLITLRACSHNCLRAHKTVGVVQDSIYGLYFLPLPSNSDAGRAIFLSDDDPGVCKGFK